MPVSTSGYAHVRLTVTDIAKSRAFYDEVFGFPVAFELPADADEQTAEQLSFLYGGVIYHFGAGLLLGLRPVAPGGDVFDEDRVGLDHLSFQVAGRADLEQAVEILDRIGAKHSGITDVGRALLLPFRDPDGVALELYTQI